MKKMIVKFSLLDKPSKELYPTAFKIFEKLDHLKPKTLEIYNDSHLHASHAAMKDSPNIESHFRLSMTSDCFAGKVNKVLKFNSLI